MDARTKDTATIDSAIDAALAEKRIVGGVVLVMQDGEIAYRRAAGLAHRERGVPMREDAVFRLALADQAAGHRGRAAHGRVGQDRACRSDHALIRRFSPCAAERRGAGHHAAPSTHAYGRPRLSLHAAGGRRLRARRCVGRRRRARPFDRGEPEAHRARRAFLIRRRRPGLCPRQPRGRRGVAGRRGEDFEAR